MTLSADSDRLDRIEQKLDTLTTDVESLTTNVESLTTDVDVLTKIVDRLTTSVGTFNDKFDNYQKATQWVVQLAFTLIASATITVIVSTVL
ncbi:MAG: hypothetical protein ACR2FS_19975 [Phormidesmis sp.]